MQQCVGLVLAAGQSRRMGRSKALLGCGPGGETFVARIVRTLRTGGVVDVLVVGRPDDEPLRQELGRLAPPPPYVQNPDAARGQLSSVLAGLARASASGAGAVMVMPVDCPQVRPETIAAMLTALASGRWAILRAVHQGRHGHPVVFSADLFNELCRADPAVGARAVVHADPARLRDLEVDDPGVLGDVDVPADYRRLFPDEG